MRNLLSDSHFILLVTCTVYTEKKNIFVSKQWMRRPQIINEYMGRAFINWKYVNMKEKYLINY